MTEALEESKKYDVDDLVYVKQIMLKRRKQITNPYTQLARKLNSVIRTLDILYRIKCKTPEDVWNSFLAGKIELRKEDEKEAF